MLSYEAQSPAPPERAWALMAQPERWSRWAPHLRGAWGLGRPEVETYGRVVQVLVRNLARVAAR